MKRLFKFSRPKDRIIELIHNDLEALRGYLLGRIWSNQQVYSFPLPALFRCSSELLALPCMAFTCLLPKPRE